MYVREKHGTRKEEWSEMRTSALASGSGAGFGAGAVSLITLERAPETIAAAGSAATRAVAAVTGSVTAPIDAVSLDIS